MSPAAYNLSLLPGSLICNYNVLQIELFYDELIMTFTDLAAATTEVTSIAADSAIMMLSAGSIGLSMIFQDVTV